MNSAYIIYYQIYTTPKLDQNNKQGDIEQTNYQKRLNSITKWVVLLAITPPSNAKSMILFIEVIYNYLKYFISRPLSESKMDVFEVILIINRINLLQ